MDLIEYLSYTNMATWVLIFFGALLFVVFLTKTKAGIAYTQKYLDTHIRVFGLIALVVLLIYSSFFIDKTQLTIDADTKRVSLESDIFLLESVLPYANEEYATLLHEIGELRSMTSGEYDKGKIYNYLSETNSKLRSLKDKVDGARSRVLTQGIGGGDYFISSLEKRDEDPIAAEIEDLDRQLSRLRETKNILEVIYSNNLRELKVVTAKYESIKKSNYSENIYYAMRALSLGGLGALITLLASYVLVEPSNANKISFVKSDHYWALVLGHTLMGAVISIVAFGLFYTKQLTIFQPDSETTSQVSPEYWRVTMLCVIAGAFAEKLYSAASNGVDKYVDKPEPNKQIQPTEKAGG